jgi:hypothetical protein
MYELTMLQQFLNVLALPRHEAVRLLPDGSSLLDCVSYGFERLVEALGASDDISISADLMTSLQNLDARLGQFARASKSWTAKEEWESVEDYARQALALIDEGAPPSSSAS